MITTVEDALSFLSSEKVQSGMKRRFEIKKGESCYYLLSGGELTRVMTAQEVIADANTYDLAFERRALLGGKVNTVRAARLSNGHYFIVWAYEHQGKRQSFPFEPTSASGALRTLQILHAQGFIIDPPDMIDQLKSVISEAS